MVAVGGRWRCLIFEVQVFSIYSFTNRITGKKYIGYTNNVSNRIRSHKSLIKRGTKNKFYDAVRSYGWNNFDFDVLYQSKEQEHTQKIMENYFINEYDTFHNGYNMTFGGEGVVGITPWSKDKKCSILKWSEERKQQHSSHLKTLWNEEKRKELSKVWTDDKKLEQKNKSTVVWKNKIESGYKVKSNETFLTCPYCHKINNVGNSKRWHYDNCKYRMRGT